MFCFLIQNFTGKTKKKNFLYGINYYKFEFSKCIRILQKQNNENENIILRDVCVQIAVLQLLAKIVGGPYIKDRLLRL